MGRGPGVRAASKSSVQIDFRYKGVRCRERISLPPTPANRKYVQRLKATIEHEIATGTFEYAKHFPESRRARQLNASGIPLLTALLDYCDSLVAQLEPETVDEYRHDCDIVAKWFPGKTLQSLTRADIRLAVSKLTLSKKRIDNLLIPLRGAFNQAVEDEVIEASPLAGFRVKRISLPKDTIDPFTPKEVEALGDQSLGYVWTFWAWSGLRSGEIIGLQWSDVESDCGAIRIRRSIRVGREKGTKTEAGTRVVRLLPAAKRSLAGLSRSEPGRPVFLNPNTDARWHEDRGLARAFRRDCAAAGVRYRYPYQLRHTFATWALSSGENPAWIAAQMGHSDTMMLFKVYGKWMPSLDPLAGSRMVSAAKSKAA